MEDAVLSNKLMSKGTEVLVNLYFVPKCLLMSCSWIRPFIDLTVRDALVTLSDKIFRNRSPFDPLWSENALPLLS